MARQQGGSNAGLYILAFFALLILGLLVWFGYRLYQDYETSNANPVQQTQVNDLQGQIDGLQTSVANIKTSQEEFKWWPVLRWILVLAVILIIVLAWLKYHYDKKTDKLTIDKALELGKAELLEKHHFVSLNQYGKRPQRRIGQNRVLLLVFSRHQKVQGMAPPPHGLMYYAVLDNDWENRYPSEPGWTFKQFMDHLHEMEVIGFSIEKTEENAGLEYLQSQGQYNETVKKLAGDLGLVSDRGA